MSTECIDERYTLGLDFEETTMTDPDLFNDAIRETCSEIDTVKRTLANMSDDYRGMLLHLTLLVARTRLDRKLAMLYRRQDAAIAAEGERHGNG